jgi:hypothetical protein
VDVQTSGSSRDLGAVLAEFASVMADQRTVEEILNRSGDYITELLPVHGVGVLMRDPAGKLLTFATANTAVGKVVEELEVELEEGPCTDALRTGEQVLAPDLASLEEVYPRFVPRALAEGVRSIHALPMAARSEQIGSMDVIALEPLDLDPAQLRTAQMLADVTVAYLVNSQTLARTSQLAAQLQGALDSRVVIEQAKGILAERHAITLSAAFERLRSHARGAGRKVHDVAAEITSGSLDP